MIYFLFITFSYDYEITAIKKLRRMMMTMNWFIIQVVQIRETSIGVMSVLKVCGSGSLMFPIEFWIT